jgi:hypothetical protein
MIIKLDGVGMHNTLQFHKLRILKKVVFDSSKLSKVQGCLTMHDFDIKM